MNIAKLRIEQATHDGAIAQAQADAQQARIDLMHKTSPIDGEVRDVIVKPGEQVDETKPVVEIVKLDPLYVEVKLVDTDIVQKLKLGDKVQVKYSDEDRWRDAVVESIDPQADSRTTTHPFRLSLPNPEGRTAGLRVEIQTADERGWGGIGDHEAHKEHEDQLGGRMPFGETTSKEIERVATVVVDAIYRVYERLGPGLLESVYEAYLAYEIAKRGLRVARQSPVSLRYDEVILDIGFRIDLLVEDCIVVELKAVEKLTPLFEAQVMTYLKLANNRLAILVNFNTKFLKDQLKRIVL